MTNSERKDYYEILGVDPSTNIKLVKNIYLQLVHKIKIPATDVISLCGNDRMIDSQRIELFISYCLYWFIFRAFCGRPDVEVP